MLRAEHKTITQIKKLATLNSNLYLYKGLLCTCIKRDIYLIIKLVDWHWSDRVVFRPTVEPMTVLGEDVMRVIGELNTVLTVTVL